MRRGSGADVDVPSQVLADDEAFFWKTLDNAKRLASDARLLSEHDRIRSAIMLAVFAVEEFGKALIQLWGVRNKANKRPFPTHVEKQAATFALLAATELTKMPKSRLLRKYQKYGGDFLKMGPLSSQFAYARSGFFDDFRMAVTYADDTPKMNLDSLNEELANLPGELLGWLDLAVDSTNSEEAMRLAATIWENDLGRM